MNHAPSKEISSVTAEASGNRFPKTNSVATHNGGADRDPGAALISPKPHRRALRASARARAMVSRHHYRGEFFYDATVRLLDGRAFQVREQPSAQSVLLAVLDWGNRMGKEIEWQYRNL
jgi:hypothetical protein